MIRYGIIGIGNIGTIHLNNFFAGKASDSTVTAVCDINPEKLKKAKEKADEQGAALEYYGDYKELLKSNNVDAVIIAVPHYQHPQMVSDALDAGKHVISEKPAGVFTKGLIALSEKADKLGLCYGMMLNQRGNPYFAKMRDLVRSGKYGKTLRLNWIITDWYRTQYYYDSGDWRATWNGEGGGVLLNQCPHNLDLWQWIFGMPKRVRGFCSFGKYHDIEVEDDVTAYAEYENGATAVFITTTGDAIGDNRLEVTCDAAQLVYEHGKLTVAELEKPMSVLTKELKTSFARPEKKTTVYEDLGTGRQHPAIIENFSRHLLYGDELLAPGRDGIPGLAISNAIHLSNYKNDWVEVGTPESEDEFLEYLNMLRRNSKKKNGAGNTGAESLEGTFGS